MKINLLSVLNKRIAMFLVSMLMVSFVSALPVKPGLRRTLTLSDGSTVNAVLVGDEFGHYWVADDGKTYQAVDGNDYFQVIDANSVRKRAKARRMASNQRRSRRLAPKREGELGDYKGKKKGLIILVNFAAYSTSQASGTTFQPSNNNELYQRIANEKNFSYGNFKGSMYDYFYAQSEGKFELTFDVVGPVQVSNMASYYGANDSEGNDKYPATMVIEALALADQYVNYADYDWDGDGEVEQVYVVYAGKGEADGGAANTIWPHEWTLDDAHYYGDGSGVQKLDGVLIDTYACGPELDGYTGKIAGIGTMCHEFSHCLGYPDFYDIDYSGGQGMGSWDLMDNGSYNGDSFQPAGYTSYERWVAGWKTPVELTSTLTVSDMKALQEGGEAYVVYNQGNRNEYFLLENRQKVGWDESLPGAGLLILHVDYSKSAWDDNTPNDDPNHQRMTWIAADNKYQYTTYQGTKYYTDQGMATDPFPYGDVNSFSAHSTPVAKFYNKNSDGTYYLDSSIEEITQNADGTISFQFKGLSNVATPTFSPSPGRYAEPQTVTINCQTEGATIFYTLDGSTPEAGVTPASSTQMFTESLVISKTTTVKAVAVVDGEMSEVATAKFVINDGSGYDPDSYFLVTDASTLSDGDKIILAYVDEDISVAISTTQNTNNRKASEVTVNDDETINPGDDTEIVTLLKNGTSYQFQVSDGYLYAGSSTKNILKTTNDADEANSVATISIDNNGDATIVFQGRNNHNVLRFNSNNGSPLFSCYASTSSVVTLPQIYKKASDVTGIIDLTTDERGESDVWFDLSGRRINGVPTSKGIYITAGKKILIK